VIAASASIDGFTSPTARRKDRDGNVRRIAQRRERGKVDVVAAAGVMQVTPRTGKEMNG
jgi:hypothetical protein